MKDNADYSCKPWRYDKNTISDVYSQQWTFNSLFLVSPYSPVLLETYQSGWSAPQAAALADVILSMSQGRLEKAILELESYLIEVEPIVAPVWHARFMLWNGLCYIYLMEIDTALYWADRIMNEFSGLVGVEAEAKFLKAMALRIAGRIEDSRSIFAKLSRNNAGLYGENRLLALVWYLECSIAAGHLRPSYTQIEWLENRSCYKHVHTGIYSAVAYRIRCLLNRGVYKRRELIRELNACPMLQHPLFTSLLGELLPKPLTGVESGARTMWYRD